MATVRIQLRRGTASQWDSANPILAAGEMGVETDTRKVKVGDGTTAWTSLDYVAADAPEIGEIAQDAINDAFVAGTGITKSYNDGSNTITVAVDTSVIATKAELAEVAQDSIDQALTAGTGITKSYNDASNTLTVSVDTSTIATRAYADQAEADAISAAASDATDKANAAQDAAEITAATALANHASDTTDVHGIADTALLVTTTGNQTLSNKTILSPSLTGTPVAPTAVDGTNSTQIATTAFVSSAVANLVASAPETLNTLNELATALSNDASFSTTVTAAIGEKVAKSGDVMTGALTLPGDPVQNLHAATKGYVDGVATYGMTQNATALSNHESATTNVHGIADTASLVTTSVLSSTLENYTTETAVDTLLNDIESDITFHKNATTNVHGIADTSVLVTNEILAAHAATTSNIHGISNTANLVYTVDLTNQITAANGYTNTSIETHNADTTNVHGIADTSVLVTNSTLNSHTSATTNVHGISDTADLVTIDGSQELTNKTITSPKINDNVDLTATSTELNVLDGITASTAELNYVDGVTSSIQAQLDLKAPLASPTFTGTVSGITKSMVGLGNVDNTADADKPVSTAAQAALDLKAPLDNPTFTGTVSGVTKSMVGLGNVDNTSDANKPVSTATQTALDAKASLSGATFTGSVEIDQNLVVDGNLTVNGTTFSASSTSIVIEDNMVQLAHDNSGNTVDLGLVVAYNDGAAKHSGIVRDVSADKWKLFKGVTTEPTTTVDFSEGSLDNLEVAGFVASSATIGDVSNTELQYLNGVTSGVQSQLDSKAPLASPTFTGTVSGITKSMVGLGNVDNTADIAKPVSAATQSQLDLKAPLASPTFFGNVILPSTTSIGNTSSSALSFLSDVTSPIQSQLNSKAPLSSPTFSGTVSVSASGIAFTDKVQTKAGVPSLTTIASTISSNTTLDALGTDAAVRDSLVPLSGAVNISFESTGNAKYSIGSSISFYQSSGTGANITGNGVTILSTPGSTLRTTNSSVTATKIAASTWLLAGDLKA